MSIVPRISLPPLAEPAPIDLTRPTLMAFVATAAVLIVATNLICVAKLGVF